MMDELPLLAVPRQEFSVTLNQRRWDIRVYQSTGGMCVDIAVDDVVLIVGVRAYDGAKLLPYRHLEAKAGGQLRFSGPVAWENFGITCRLYHVR